LVLVIVCKFGASLSCLEVQRYLYSMPGQALIQSLVEKISICMPFSCCTYLPVPPSHSTPSKFLPRRKCSGTRCDVQANGLRCTVLKIVHFHIALAAHAISDSRASRARKRSNRVLVSRHNGRGAIILTNIWGGVESRAGVSHTTQDSEIQTALLAFLFLNAGEVVRSC